NVRTAFTEPPANIVRSPLTMLEPPEVASTCRVEFVTKITPPLLMSRLLINRSGVAAPALVSCSVLTVPAGPDTVRLLMVIVLTLAALVVVASIVTVLVVALAMRFAGLALDGAPLFQFAPVSHLPVPAIQ